MSDLFAAVIIFLTTMQETRVRSLGQQDPFEKGVATHSRRLPGDLLWAEEGAKWATARGVTKSWT